MNHTLYKTFVKQTVNEHTCCTTRTVNYNSRFLLGIAQKNSVTNQQLTTILMYIFI